MAKVHEVDTILQKWAMQQQFTGKMEALTRRQAPPKGRSLFFKFNVSLAERIPYIHGMVAVLHPGTALRMVVSSTVAPPGHMTMGAGRELFSQDLLNLLHFQSQSFRRLARQVFM